MQDSLLITQKNIVDKFYEEWELNAVIFEINAPYKPSLNTSSRKRKRKGHLTPAIVLSATGEPSKESPKSDLQLRFDSFRDAHFPKDITSSSTQPIDNKLALTFMDSIHTLTYPETAFNGGNANEKEITFNFNSESYLIPPNCQFFNKNVLEISKFLAMENQFDFIVMDPPWWNKYIRRLNAVKQENGYKMLNNEDIKSLPIDQLLSPNGLVVIWCTNSPSHREAVEKEMLPHWKLKMITVWHWMKVTKTGDPICDFHPGTGKQPYELIFIAGRQDKEYISVPRDVMLASVPSVIHSHKFPIFDVLKPFLEPEIVSPNCLEIFARYLQPNFTSVGLEVLKLQNVKLFSQKEEEKRGEKNANYST